MSLSVLLRSHKVAGSVIGPFLCLWIAPAFSQTLVAIPGCGEAGKTKVCVTGSGWAEPSPVCFYRFLFDGAQVVFPDQPDGLFGPPKRSFTVPGGAAAGDHKIRVDLRLSSNGSLLQTKEIPFKVVAAGGGSSISTTPAGGASITITYEPPLACEVSCKKVVFLQTVRRFAVKDNPAMDEVITKSTDWKNIPDADKKAGVETDPGRRRVDQYWGASSPYYNQNNGLVEAGNNDGGVGQVGSTDPNKNDATLFDQPDTPATSFPAQIGGVPVKKAILRFEAAPFCAEGNDAGKFLGHVVTWEHHQDKGMAGTVQNIATATGEPSTEFKEALEKWVDAKKFPIPQPKPVPCP